MANRQKMPILTAIVWLLLLLLLAYGVLTVIFGAQQYAQNPHLAPQFPIKQALLALLA